LQREFCGPVIVVISAAASCYCCLPNNKKIQHRNKQKNKSKQLQQQPAGSGLVNKCDKRIFSVQQNNVNTAKTFQPKIRKTTNKNTTRTTFLVASTCRINI